MPRTGSQTWQLQKVVLPEDSMLSDCTLATMLLPLNHACQGFQHFLQPCRSQGVRSGGFTRLYCLKSHAQRLYHVVASESRLPRLPALPAAMLITGSQIWGFQKVALPEESMLAGQTVFAAKQPFHEC